MKYTTVGELIEALQQFPIDTPVFKADPVEPEYFEIALTPNLLFRIESVCLGPAGTCYIDAHDEYSGFLAVAL